MEARILEALGVDFIDESEVLTPADEERHVDKTDFRVPFVCGARNLGEGLRRLNEGAAMLRTKGEAGTGNVVEAVRHARTINREIAALKGMDAAALAAKAAEYRVPLERVAETVERGRFSVVNFAAGGIATPADAALLMALGVDGVFVGSGVFKSEQPQRMAEAIVQAVIHWENPDKLVAVSKNLGKAMVGIEIQAIETRLAERGV
jgi:pyridoxal 5'-phosphate synthase pdxS subunit